MSFLAGIASQQVEELTLLQPTANPKKPLKAVKFNRCTRAVVNDYLHGAAALSIVACSPEGHPLEGSSEQHNVTTCPLVEKHYLLSCRDSDFLKMVSVL